MAKKGEWAIAQNVGASFGPSRSSRPRAKWNWNVPALAYPLTPSSPFFSLPLLSAILLLFDLYEVYTHTLLGSFLLSSRSISRSLFFLYRPISIFQQRNEQTNVEPKRKDFAPEKNVEKVERGSEAEAEKKIKTGFFFSLFLGWRPKRADDDGINNRDIVDFHVEQHRLGSKKRIALSPRCCFLFLLLIWFWTKRMKNQST